MKVITGMLAALLLLGSVTAGEARECVYKKGEARWDIKTSVPSGALSQTITRINLQSLMDLHNPKLTKAQKAAIANNRWQQDVALQGIAGDGLYLMEGDIIGVQGYLYRARCQRDGDYHLEIGGSDANGHKCLIVEVPDPHQVHNKRLRAKVKSVIQTVDALPSSVFNGKSEPLPVEVTGQLFLDAPHIRKGKGKKKPDPSGGRGTKFNGKNCATNVWEIHPITDFKVEE